MPSSAVDLILPRGWSDHILDCVIIRSKTPNVKMKKNTPLRDKMKWNLKRIFTLASIYQKNQRSLRSIQFLTDTSYYIYLSKNSHTTLEFWVALKLYTKWIVWIWFFYYKHKLIYHSWSIKPRLQNTWNLFRTKDFYLYKIGYFKEVVGIF